MPHTLLVAPFCVVLRHLHMPRCAGLMSWFHPSKPCCSAADTTLQHRAAIPAHASAYASAYLLCSLDLTWQRPAPASASEVQLGADDSDPTCCLACLCIRLHTFACTCMPVHMLACPEPPPGQTLPWALPPQVRAAGRCGAQRRHRRARGAVWGRGLRRSCLEADPGRGPDGRHPRPEVRGWIRTVIRDGCHRTSAGPDGGRSCLDCLD